MVEIDLSNVKHKLAKNGTTYYYWEDSVGAKIPFIYYDIKGEFTILPPEKDKNYVTVDYNGKKYNIVKNKLKTNKLQTIFGYRPDWQFEIGDIIFDENEYGKVRNLTITAREHKKIRPCDKKINHKYYQYKCNICGYDCTMDNSWLEEVVLQKGVGCPCCAGNKTIQGINDIGTTHPQLADLIIDKDFVHTHSYGTAKMVKMKCPDCGTVKLNNPLRVLTQGFGCPKCSDGISYPEKFMANVLDQLEIEYIRQFNCSYCDWIKGKIRYDFYLPDYNTIIETHGEQHYSQKKHRWSPNTQKQDIKKYELALSNNITNYVVIDCSRSNRDYIKKSIYNSWLQHFDLDKIDWLKADKEACSNLIKKVCDMFDKLYPDISANILSKEFKVDKSTIIQYLKRGAELGITKHYQLKEENKRINSEMTSSPILAVLNNQKYAFRSQTLFFKWINKVYNKKGNLQLSKYIGKRPYKDCEIFNITKEQFNNFCEEKEDVITSGEPFVLLSA